MSNPHRLSHSEPLEARSLHSADVAAEAFNAEAFSMNVTVEEAAANLTGESGGNSTGGGVTARWAKQPPQ